MIKFSTNESFPQQDFFLFWTDYYIFVGKWLLSLLPYIHSVQYEKKINLLTTKYMPMAQW